MTWVIGASSFLGYGAMISDIRVSLGDGSERDMLQKAYGLGPFIVGGFAGSVKIGFQLLESLTLSLTPPAGGGQPGEIWMWEPVGVAETWQEIAVQVFANADEEERANHSHILLVEISNEIDPETAHILNVVHGPRAFIIKMMSPDFLPVVMKKPLSVDHIGSGAHVDRYIELLKAYVDPMSGTLKETAAFGAWPRLLADGVRQAVGRNPTEGVSPHVHVLVCSQGEIFAMNNDTRIFRGDTEIGFKMPKVARSYAEFLSMCSASGLAAECACG
jgi:hypothetical protein